MTSPELAPVVESLSISLSLSPSLSLCELFLFLFLFLFPPSLLNLSRYRRVRMCTRVCVRGSSSIIGSFRSTRALVIHRWHCDRRLHRPVLPPGIPPRHRPRHRCHVSLEHLFVVSLFSHLSSPKPAFSFSACSRSRSSPSSSWFASPVYTMGAHPRSCG
jgi:hypothetical protein